MKKYTLFACLTSMLLVAFQSNADEYTPYYDEWSVGSGKFKIGADWLYWQVNQDNLDAATIIKQHGADNNDLKTCRFVSQNEKWHNGYRVNIGYEFCDCWELALYYTDLPTRTNSRHHQFEDNSNTFKYIGDSFFVMSEINLSPLNALHAKWRSNLSWLDLDLSRTVCFGECFTLRPHIGVRALWNNRTFHIHGEFDLKSKERTLDINLRDPYFSARFKDDVAGYGAEGGVWGNWELACGLSVVGHFGGSILYSKHRTHQHAAAAFFYEQDSTQLAEGEKNKDKPIALNPVNWRHSHFFGIPTMDYFIGLQYESTFCDFILTTTIGWEQHIFFDINRISRHRGNLSAQGLTLGFEAAF